MGAGASLFKKKGGKSKVTDEIKPGNPAKEEVTDVDNNEKHGQEESELVTGDIDDILCRITQAHAPGNTKRWGLITKQLNGTLKKKKIPAQPLKTLLAKEGLCIPQCWATGMAADATKRELAKENARLEKNKGVFGGKFFGKSKPASNDKSAIEQEAGESETEPESDIEAEHPTVVNPTSSESAGAEKNEQHYVYQPLTKYEVFSFMRGLHDRIGPRVLETEEAVENVDTAIKVVNRLYEKLPAATAKAVSQENRIRSGLTQNSLVYGEMEIASFVKVLIKLKRVHGHMMKPGGSFWDLGAGVGKLVIAAAVVQNFESCYGVEVLEVLRDASRPMLIRWRQEEVQKLKAAKASIRLDFMFADIMKQEGWMSEATLLLVHTNLSTINMHELRKRAGGMKVGAICLSVSLPAVEEDKWGLLAVEHIVTSWGTTKLYVHEKLVA